jgi:FkbM family methyltransferase
LEDGKLGARLVRKVRALLKSAASAVGYEIRRERQVRELVALEALRLLRDQGDSELSAFLAYVFANNHKSHAQLFQDLFVLFTLGEKQGGYFVEFGAADGLFLSNSALLEKQYGWNGIVAEPSKNWEAALRRNRRCGVDLRCVWKTTGDKLTFSETGNAEFSTISDFKSVDYHDRRNSREYEVETVSLNDLLSHHGAPQEIDYLSIDTEGSEFSILQEIDFARWSFKVITVEHNFQKQRTALHSLLSSHNYIRVFEAISSFDDWYVNPNIVDATRRGRIGGSIIGRSM